MAGGRSPGSAWEVLDDFKWPLGFEMLSLVVLVVSGGVVFSPKLLEKLLKSNAKKH